MSKNLFTKFFVLLLIVGLLFAVAPTKQAEAADRDVCPSGCTYTTITAALAAAAPGDTITVAAGTYSENLAITKSVSLIGAGRGVTTITAANPALEPIQVEAPNVTISGFRVTGTTGVTTDGIWVKATASGCTIKDNDISGNAQNGMSIESTGVTVTHNIFSGNSTASTKGAGVALFNGGNTVQFNIVTGNAGYGGIGSVATTANNIANNWWGSATGPTHASNPGGTGDKIYTNQAISLLTYSPWLANPPVHNVTQGTNFATIQAAIDAAANGDTIEVPAGTYVEDVTVTNKFFNLIGEVDGTGAPVSILQGTLSINNPTVSPEFTNIKNIYFERTDNHLLILTNINGALIENCVFDGNNGFMLYQFNGIEMPSGSANGNTNITVKRSLFKDGLYVGIGGYALDPTVEDSTFTNLKSGINMQGGSTILTVKNTDFSVIAQAAGSDTYGIRLGSSGAGTGKQLIMTDSSITVNKNGLIANSGTYHAAVILRAGVDGLDSTIRDTALLGDIVNLSTAVTLDATENWWGQATGPAAGALSGDVSYIPWCGEATCDTLVYPEFNGAVSGVMTTTSGNVTGTLTGTYTLNIIGQVTGYSNNRATFTGTVTGDIVGNIQATINDNGVDTLAGTITNSGANLPVRILGIFPQSGTTGDFEGQIITGTVPDLATSMSMTSAGNATTVFSTRTLQLGVVIDPATAAYGQWSLWEPEGQTPTGSTITQDGLLTAGANPGTVVVIAKALDGSLLDAQKTITIQELPDTKLLMQTPVEGVCDSNSTGEFTVGVLIQGATDVMSYDVEVDFDKTMVQVTKVENGTFLTGNLLYPISNGFNNATGIVNFGASLIGSGGDVEPVDGSGTLFTITFKPLKAGVSAFVINAAGSELVHYPSYLLIPFEVIGDGSLDFGGIVKNVNTGAEYCALSAAVTEASAVTPQTLELLANINIPSGVKVEKGLTIDLAGFTLKRETSTAGYVILSGAGGALTINDSSVGKTGTILGVNSSADPELLVVGVYVGAKDGASSSLTVNGGTIVASYAGLYVRAETDLAKTPSIVNATITGGTIGSTTTGSGVMLYGSAANLTLEGGSIIGADMGVTGNGTVGFGGTNLTVKGGQITSLGTAIYQPQAGEINISGGTITGPTAIEMRSGTLNVTGGTIHGTGDYVAVPDLKDGWTTATGDAIFVGTSDGTYPGNIQVNISGTTAVITSDEGYALREAVLASVPATKAKKINIIGGQLTGGVDTGNEFADEAVTFSSKLVDANTAGTSDLDLLPGGKYNTDPGVFVYAPYGSYYAAPWWQIMDLTGTIAWDPGQTGQVVGEAPLSVVVAGNVIDFTGKIEWYPTAPGRTEGNRVGVQVTAPAGFPTAGTTFTFAGATYNWDDVNDGDNFVWIYPKVTTVPQSWDIVVTWKTGVTQTFTVNVKDTSTLNTPPAPTITSTDVFGPYIPGVPREFTFNVSNAGGADYALATFDYQIVGVSKADIASFEYKNELGNWIAMGSRPQETYLDCTVGGVASICGQFGWAPDGFGPFPTDFAGVSQFRVKFLNGKVDPLPLTLTLKGKKLGTETDWTVLQTFTANIEVYENVQITGTAPVYYLVGDAGESTITITNPDGGAPYGNHIEFNLTILGAVKADIQSATCTYGPVTLDILGMLSEVGGNLTGTLFPADGAFEVGAPFSLTIPCTMVFNTAKDYTSTSEMVYVVGTDKYVVATNTATATVYTKPVITSLDLPGSFQQGVAETVTINVDNVDTMYTPNSFVLHLGFPEGTVVVYGPDTYTCTAAGCDIPVTLAEGANPLALTVTFNAPSTADVSVALVDTAVDPDRTLATFTAGNVVHANVALVTGTVTMQARSIFDHAKFKLTGTFMGYGPYDSSTSNAAGELSFTNIIADTYTVTTNMPRYLNITTDLAKTIALSGNDALNPLWLRGGNAVWFGHAVSNNKIDIHDANLVGTDWTTLFPVQDLTINCGDVNFDGKVNIQDLALVGGNFDLTNAQAYGTWLP